MDGKFQTMDLENICIELPTNERLSTREIVFKTLQNAIVQNVILPGTWLSEEKLSKKLQVSRTPIREALHRLQSNQLIERGENGRLYVKELSVKEANDLYAVRIALEDLVITQAAERMTELGFSKLYTELEKMHLADKQNNTVSVGDSGKDFHNVLCSIADNEVIKHVLNYLQPRFDRYRYFSTSTGKKRTSKAIQEHVKIYEALKKGNIAEARELMKIHLENSRQTVINSLLTKEVMI